MKIIQRIERLRAREHEATVDLVTALVECERTGAHLDFGFASIWDLLVRHLHYSNAAASRRYKAMKCVRANPEVLGMLRKHQVNLSTLAMVEANLARSDDPKGLLRAITGKSQRQVEGVLARLNPVRPGREVVRRKVVQKPLLPDAISTSAAERSAKPASDKPTLTSAAELEERVHLSFSVSAEVFERFERAKAILSRKLPAGVTLDAAFEEFVEFYLMHKAPKERKTPTRPSSGRHIPVALRDEVFLRDRGRCTYTGPTGQQCGSTRDLEVDHIEPFALGGKHEPHNLRLLCGQHNRHRARKTFGEPKSLPQRKSERNRQPALTLE